MSGLWCKWVERVSWSFPFCLRLRSFHVLIQYVSRLSLYACSSRHLGEKEEEGDAEPLSVQLATDAIKAALVHTFGYVHGALPFEVFAILPKERHAVIKIDKR